MPPESTKIICRLLADPTVSFWLKKAINELLIRDCIDALNDTEILHALMEIRVMENLKEQDYDLN